ncbi:MAG: hypothetical protein IKY72_08455 [Bacteroidaceae bacterium]|nr:hypothetical protein [Bacteroidaceae bacterium]
MRKTKLLLFIALLLGTVGAAKADVATTDKVEISSLTVEPGSSDVYSFTVSLEGSDKLYTAYQVDLQFPEGLEPAYNNKGQLRVSMVKSSLYPYSVEEEEDEEGEIVEVKSYTHTLNCAFNEGSTLRVVVMSTANEVFTKTSGSLFKVYVQTTPYLKPGDVEIKVKNVKFVTPDETKYLPEDYVSTAVQATTTSTLTLKVSAANKFGTCILPFDYALPADGSLEAYTCEAYTDDALVLTKVTEMAAYTPYILYSDNGFSATISGTVDAAKYPAGGTVKSGHLVGTLVPCELTEGSYVMQNQGDGPMFYRVGDVPFALSAGKCYVELPEGTNVTSLRIGGSTTGIESIHNSEFIIQNCVYNLLGQPVSNMQPGHVYIVNGRKVIN